MCNFLNYHLFDGIRILSAKYQLKCLFDFQFKVLKRVLMVILHVQFIDYLSQTLTNKQLQKLGRNEKK